LPSICFPVVKMEYFKILNLNKEPFSNSPEPEFFYESLQHVQCLQNLELAIRLRRGLNVVIGDVGTGKTTLCRQLINKFDGYNNVKTFLLLDPAFTTPTEFLTALFKMFGIDTIHDSSATEWQLKEVIKNYIFEQGVVKDNTVVLIIDEGQKIPDMCLEILREFLNYETNEYKLLQIVIFAQREFENTLRERSNFTDRINFLHELGPLNFRDTRSMIR
jgi:general secretion pathway protein A